MRPANFYEAMDPKGDFEYGTGDAASIVDWHRKYPDRSIYVSVWDEESEKDFRLLNDRIDITAILKQGR